MEQQTEVFQTIPIQTSLVAYLHIMNLVLAEVPKARLGQFEKNGEAISRAVVAFIQVDEFTSDQIAQYIVKAPRFKSVFGVKGGRG